MYKMTPTFELSSSKRTLSKNGKNNIQDVKLILIGEHCNFKTNFMKGKARMRLYTIIVLYSIEDPQPLDA